MPLHPQEHRKCLRNTGITPTHFSFAPANDHEEQAKRWLTVTPQSSFLEIGATVEVTLQVAVENEQLCGITSKGETKLVCILIAHLSKGRDYFVTVSATYQKKDAEQPVQSPDVEKIVPSSAREGIIVDLVRALVITAL